MKSKQSGLEISMLNSYNRLLVHQKIRVLQIARERVKLGFKICECLASAGRVYPTLQEAATDLRHYVMKALDESIHLEGWQLRNGFDPNNRDGTEDRVQWVDWMIRELKGQLCW
jgi:hypothetical protein